MPLPPEVVESFPEDIRTDPSWEKFNDVGMVAKGYLEAQKKKDSGISIPDEKAAPEDLEKWKGEHLPKLAARGLIELPPSKAEDYKLPTIEGYSPDKAMTESFIKDVALANGMTPKMVEAVLKFDAQRTAAMKGAFVEADAAEAEFKTLMGDDYEAVNGKITRAQQAFAEDNPAVSRMADRLRVFEVDESGKPTGKIYPFNSHPFGKTIYETLAVLTEEDHSAGMMPTGETPESVETKIQDVRANKDISDEEKGRRLEPLYKLKVKLKPKAA